MNRYEKKYGYLSIYAQSLEFSLLEQGFITTYKPRFITSFYYDSHDFSLYSESIRGDGKRYKLRARFYDFNDKFYLEKKIRKHDKI